MDQQARDKLTKARIMLLYKQPFYGALSLRLMPEEVSPGHPLAKKVKTLATDGERLYYSPPYVKSLNKDVAMSAVAHEVQHCVWDHMGRLQGRKPKKWNYATDYVSNDLLKKVGFTLAPGWLWEPQWTCDMSADEVYNKIPDPPEDDDDDGAGNGPQDTLLPPQTPDQQQKLRDEWKGAVAAAALAAHQMGNLPAELERFVKDLLNPVIDWREQLRRYFTAQAKTDFSWRRMNKPMQHYGVLLPSLYSERMGPMINAIDVSGSIMQRQLNQFGSEVQGIREQAFPEKIINIYCDSRIQRVDEFEPEDELTFKLTGGGGTDFRPVFKYIEDNDLKPAVLTFFTDGYGTFPDVPPAYDVLWLIIDSKVVPPFGETIYFHDMDA